MRMIVAIIALLLSVGSAAAGLDAEAQAAISRYRQQHGLPAVKADPMLMQLAREQASAMASAGVLEHDVGRSFSARIARYNPETAAENIAGGTRDFPATLSIWQRSSGHDANLLRRGVTRFGIASAAAPNSRYKVFWSLILAAPSSDRGPRLGPGRRRPSLMRSVKCVFPDCRPGE